MMDPMLRAWTYQKDTGGYKAVSRVSSVLKYRNYSVMDFVCGKAREEIQKDPSAPPFTRAESASQVIYLLETGHLNPPDVFITSACSNGGAGRDLISTMKHLGVPTVVVTDFWTGAHITKFTFGKFWTAIICVQDQLANDITL